MQDRQQSNQDQQQQDPQKQNNPESLALTDEAQRLKQGQSNQTGEQVPVGNERDEDNETEGSQAGMGE